MKKSIDRNGERPDAWLFEAVLVALFCFFPIGIPAVLVALRSGKKWMRGDAGGAEMDARRARKLTVAGFWSGVGFAVIYVITIIVAGKMAGK